VLETNLASRPFYNERRVRFVLGLAAVLVAGMTVLNAVTLLRLSGSQTRLGAHAEEAEREAARLRAEAERIRTRIDRRQLESVSAAAREVRGLVDRRAFAWTALFNQFERTLPPDVRIKAVQPHLEKGVFTVAVVAQARRIEDLVGFIEALEATGAFHDVQPRTQTRRQDGLLEVVIDGTYAAAVDAQGWRGE
jgi:Tfp pilus assembly protein PilN